MDDQTLDEFPDLRAAKAFPRGSRAAKSWAPPERGKIAPRYQPRHTAPPISTRQRGVSWTNRYRRGREPRRQPFPPRGPPRRQNWPGEMYMPRPPLSPPSSPRSEMVADGLVWQTGDEHVPLPGTLVVGKALPRDEAKRIGEKNTSTRQIAAATLAIGKAVSFERWDMSMKLTQELEQATQEVFGSNMVKLVSIMTEEYVD